MALTNSPIGNVGGAGEKVASWQNIFRTSWNTQLFKSYAPGIYYFYLLYGDLKNNAQKIANEEWYGYEQGSPFTAVKLTGASNVGGKSGAGVSVTATVHGDSITASATGYKIPVRVGDILLMTDNGVVIVDEINVSSPSAPVLTLKPLLATYSVAVIANASSYAIISGSKAAGTGQVESRVHDYISRLFYSQTFQETYTQEGSVFVKEPYVATNEDGSTFAIWRSELLLAEQSLDRQIEGALWWGEPNTNGAVATATNITSPNVSRSEGVGNLKKTLKGINSWHSELGWSEEFAIAALTTTDFDNIIDNLKAVGVNNGKVLVTGGYKVIRALEALGYTVAGAAKSDKLIAQSFYNAFDSTDEELAINLGFTSFSKGGYTFGFQPLDSFSHPEFMGLSSYKLDRTAFVIPLTTAVISDAFKNKTTVPIIRLMHPAMDAYNRGIRSIWNTGAGGNDPTKYTTDVDQVNWFMRQSVGLEVFRARTIGMLNPAS